MKKFDQDISGNWGQLEDPYRESPDIMHNATLVMGENTFRFADGVRILLVNGKYRLALPAAPFVLREDIVYGRQFLYVPLKATMQALHGSAAVDLSKRSASITLPAFGEKAK